MGVKGDEERKGVRREGGKNRKTGTEEVKRGQGGNKLMTEKES